MSWMLNSLSQLRFKEVCPSGEMIFHSLNGTSILISNYFTGHFSRSNFFATCLIIFYDRLQSSYSKSCAVSILVPPRRNCWQSTKLPIARIFWAAGPFHLRPSLLSVKQLRANLANLWRQNFNYGQYSSAARRVNVK